jgi:hypothetical protein
MVDIIIANDGIGEEPYKHLKDITHRVYIEKSNTELLNTAPLDQGDSNRFVGINARIAHSLQTLGGFDCGLLINKDGKWYLPSMNAFTRSVIATRRDFIERFTPRLGDPIKNVSPITEVELAFSPVVAVSDLPEPKSDSLSNLNANAIGVSVVNDSACIVTIKCRRDGSYLAHHAIHIHSSSPKHIAENIALLDNYPTAIVSNNLEFLVREINHHKIFKEEGLSQGLCSKLNEKNPNYITVDDSGFYRLDTKQVEDIDFAESNALLAAYSIVINALPEDCKDK